MLFENLVIGPMFAAFLNIVTVCDMPVYVAGMSEDGEYLVGTHRYVLNDKRAYTHFLLILEQIGGEGVKIEVESFYGPIVSCPTHTALAGPET